MGKKYQENVMGSSYNSPNKSTRLTTYVSVHVSLNPIFAPQEQNFEQMTSCTNWMLADSYPYNYCTECSTQHWSCVRTSLLNVKMLPSLFEFSCLPSPSFCGCNGSNDVEERLISAESCSKLWKLCLQKKITATVGNWTILCKSRCKAYMIQTLLQLLLITALQH